MIREYIIEALRISCELTIIPLGVAALLGLFVAIAQAVTQVQEHTTVYCVKLIGVVAAVFALRHLIEERFLHLMRILGVLMAGAGNDLTW